MRSYMLSLLMAMLVGGVALFAQEDEQGPPMPRHEGHFSRPAMMAKLKLTDDQKSQMKNIKFETSKKEIELRSHVALSRLELGRLIMSDTPDKTAIEKKMSEVAANEVSLKMNKLNGWFQANAALTPEQQKIWREVLRMEAMKKMGRGEMEHGEREPMRRPEKP